jgi:hypothetical protein
VETAEPGKYRNPLAPGRGARGPAPRPKFKHATITERINVLDLATRGISQTEIARATGLRQQVVSDICRKHEPTVSTALGVLKANAHLAAEEWVKSFPKARKRGEHRPMRDCLVAVGVVAPDPINQGVTVIVGSGDVAVGTLSPMLTLPELQESPPLPLTGQKPPFARASTVP